MAWSARALRGRPLTRRRSRAAPAAQESCVDRGGRGRIPLRPRRADRALDPRPRCAAECPPRRRRHAPAPRTFPFQGRHWRSLQWRVVGVVDAADRHRKVEPVQTSMQALGDGVGHVHQARRVGWLFEVLVAGVAVAQVIAELDLARDEGCQSQHGVQQRLPTLGGRPIGRWHSRPPGPRTRWPRPIGSPAPRPG